jgi:hypothetical protein
MPFHATFKGMRVKRAMLAVPTMSTTADNYELPEEAVDEHMESDDARLNAIAEIAIEDEEDKGINR